MRTTIVRGVLGSLLATLLTAAAAHALPPQPTTLQDLGGDFVAVGADGSLTCSVSGTVTVVQGTAGSGPFVRPTDGTHSLDINADGSLNTVTTPPAPTSPSVQIASATSIAANGGSANLNSTDITANTKKLRKVVVSCTAQAKLELKKVENTVVSSTILVLRTSNVDPTVEFEVPHQDFITIANSAGSDNFRIAVTNTEPAGGGTADCDATFLINE